jgi:hypothetical protein
MAKPREQGYVSQVSRNLELDKSTTESPIALVVQMT